MKGKKLWMSLFAIIVLGSGAYYILKSDASSGDGQVDPFVVAEVGSVVEKALAVGTIEPENEIEIKSKISGVVSQIFAQPGEYVMEGQPLIEVKPDPTPLELAEAKRNLERMQIEKNSLESEMKRMQKLMVRELVSAQEYEQLEQEYEDAKIRLQISQERLDLLESGRISIGDTVLNRLSGHRLTVIFS